MSGFLASIFEGRPQAGTLPLNDAKPWRELGIIGSSASGVSVSPDGAMTYAAVLACVRVLAETLASLPLITYEQLGRRRERAREFYLYRLLRYQPNPRLTAFDFRKLLQVHLHLWGNAYCEIEYNEAGQVTALWPLLPWMMREVKVEDGELSYRYEVKQGRVVTLPSWRVWHLRDISFNGIVGLAISDLAGDSIGLGMAAEKFGATFFGNGARPSGLLEHPGQLGDDAVRHLRESWHETHGGLSRANKVAILEEGMKYTATGTPPEQAQFLETRKYQRTEVAGILRVPPHMIGDLEHATFSNIEHQQIAFVVHTMLPWFTCWEQSIFINLMTRGQQERYFPEFLVDGLLRGDIKSRYEAYGVGIERGFMTRNEAREKENLNPLPGLDRPLVPLNMATVGEGEQGAGRSGRGAGEQGSRGAEAHYRLIVEEAAGRVVRKELAAMSRASERAGGDREAWGTAVIDFYGDHAEFVSQTMRVSLERAVLYCEQGQRELLLDGYEAAADWQPRRVMALADLAVGDE